MSTEPHHKYETNPFLIIINGVKQAFNHSQQLAVMLIVIPLVLGVGQFVVQMFNNIYSLQFDSGRSVGTGMLIVGSLFFLLAVVLQILVQYLFIGFQFFSVVKIAKREDAKFSEAIEVAFSKFWRVLGLTLMISIYALPYIVALLGLVVANVVIGLLQTVALTVTVPASIVLGSILAVLAVRVYLRFSMAGIYLFEGSHSISASMDRSKQLTQGRLAEVFGVTSIASMVPFINALSSAGGLAVLYSQLVVARESKAELPKQSLLNYLVLFLMLVVLLFAGGIALLVFVVSKTN